MIRLATMEDKDECLALADEHIRHVGSLTRGEEVNQDSVNALTDYILTNDSCACFVYVKNGEIIGLLAGNIESPTLNTNRYFVECLFVFKPGRGAYSVPLIKAVKEFVVDAELDGLIMAHMTDAGNRVEKLYDKLGLNELERKYIWTPTK